MTADRQISVVGTGCLKQEQPDTQTSFCSNRLHYSMINIKGEDWTTSVLAYTTRLTKI